MWKYEKLKNIKGNYQNLILKLPVTLNIGNPVMLNIVAKVTGNSITFPVNNVFKNSSAYLTEIFCWTWLVAISTESFTEHNFNR